MFFLTTYDAKNPSEDVAFYVQRVGSRAGSPMRSPSANCYEVIIYEPEKILPDYLYYMVMAASNAGAFQKYIGGSVIPFITIEDWSVAFHEYYSDS